MHTEHQNSENTEAASEIDGPEAIFADCENESQANLVREAFSSQARSIFTRGQLNDFLEEHFDQFQKIVRLSCFLIPEQTEDVIQDVYLGLTRSIERLAEGIRKPWAFVRTLARRMAVDAYRRSMVQNRKFVPLYDDTFDAQREAVHENISANEIRDIINHSLIELAVRQRTVIVKVFLDGMSGREVSKELGLSESYVAELKALALAQLRQTLHPHTSTFKGP